MRRTLDLRIRKLQYLKFWEVEIRALGEESEGIGGMEAKKIENSKNEAGFTIDTWPGPLDWIASPTLASWLNLNSPILSQFPLCLWIYYPRPPEWTSPFNLSQFLGSLILIETSWMMPFPDHTELGNEIHLKTMIL